LFYPKTNQMAAGANCGCTKKHSEIGRGDRMVRERENMSQVSLSRAFIVEKKIGKPKRKATESQSNGPFTCKLGGV